MNNTLTEIKSLPLLAYLRILDIRPVKVLKDQGEERPRVHFYFQDNATLQSILKEYQNKKCLAEVSAYHEALREVKGQIYKMLDEE